MGRLYNPEERLKKLGYPLARYELSKGCVVVLTRRAVKTMTTHVLDQISDTEAKSLLGDPPTPEQIQAVHDDNVRALRVALGGDPDVPVFSGAAR